MIKQIESYFQKQAFGVCAWLGDILGIESSRIRLFFIHVSFLTFGSPLIIYLVLAFWLDMYTFFQYRKHRTVWEL